MKPVNESKWPVDRGYSQGRGGTCDWVNGREWPVDSRYSQGGIGTRDSVTLGQIFPAGDFQWRWEKLWKYGLLVPLLLVYEVLGVNPRSRQALYQLRDLPGHFCSLAKTPCNSRVWTQPHQHTWLCYIQKKHRFFFLKLIPFVYWFVCLRVYICACHGLPEGVRAQLEVDFLLLPCWSRNWTHVLMLVHSADLLSHSIPQNMSLLRARIVL